MNRRNFIGGLLALGASFTVLPPATTYDRIWKAQYIGGHKDTFIFNPADYVGKWSFIMESLDVNSNPVLVELA